jgi:hypothetical protein
MTRTLLVLSVGWLVTGAAPAQAGIIFTTFDPGLTYPEPFSAFDISDADGPFGYVSTAVPFSTPSGQTPLRLDRVYSVSFGSLAANPIYSLALYASTGGPASTPAQQIAVLNRGLHRDDFAGSTAVYRHTPGGEVLLDPNTEYWLVGFVAPADAVPGLDSLWFIHDSNLPAHSIANRFAPNDPWSRQDFPADFLGRPLFQVEATAVPEPTTLAVFAVLALGVGVVRRARRPLASA